MCECVDCRFSVQRDQYSAVLIPPWSSSFVDALGPPMEARGRADTIRPLLECGTASELGVLKVLETGKVLVHQSGVGHRPAGARRAAIRGRTVARRANGRGLAPAAACWCATRTIEHQDNLLGGGGSYFAREFCELDVKNGDADGSGQMKEGASRGGMDKANQMSPRKALLHSDRRPLTNWRPDAPEQRFQADTMFINCPELHLGMRKRRGHRS